MVSSHGQRINWQKNETFTVSFQVKVLPSANKETIVNQADVNIGKIMLKTNQTTNPVPDLSIRSVSPKTGDLFFGGTFVGLLLLSGCFVTYISLKKRNS